MKKILNIILALTIICTMFVVPTFANDINFSDVNRNTPEGQAIYKLAEAGILLGDGNGLFRPNDSITRAELSKIVNAIFGYNEKAETGFLDVTLNDWFYPYVMVAKKAGYIVGFDDGTFRGNEKVSREQACTILCRVANLYDLGISIEIKDKVSPWAVPYVNKVVTNGLMPLEPGSTFRATENITRAEFCKTFANFYTKPTNPVSDYKVSVKDGNNHLINASIKIENNMVIVALPTTHTIAESIFKVEVKDVSGKAIPNVTIKVTDKNRKEITLITNASGIANNAVSPKPEGGGSGGGGGGGGGGGVVPKPEDDYKVVVTANGNVIRPNIKLRKNNALIILSDDNTLKENDIIVTITSKKTGKAIKGILVTIKDKNGDEYKGSTDNNGSVTEDILNPSQLYKVTVKDENKNIVKAEISFNNDDIIVKLPNTHTIEKNVITVEVKDNSGKAVSGMLVTVYDNNKQQFSEKTNSQGIVTEDITKPINPKEDYKVTAKDESGKTISADIKYEKGRFVVSLPTPYSVKLNRITVEVINKLNGKGVSYVAVEIVDKNNFKVDLRTDSKGIATENIELDPDYDYEVTVKSEKGNISDVTYDFYNDKLTVTLPVSYKLKVNEITVTVKNKINGKYVGGYPVIIEDRYGKSYEGKTDYNGTVKEDLRIDPDIDYDVDIRDENDYLIEATKEYKNGEFVIILPNIYSLGRNTVTVKITDKETGYGVSGVAVKIIDTGKNEFKGKTDGNGIVVDDIVFIKEVNKEMVKNLRAVVKDIEKNTKPESIYFRDPDCKDLIIKVKICINKAIGHEETDVINKEFIKETYATEIEEVKKIYDKIVADKDKKGALQESLAALDTETLQWLFDAFDISVPEE